MIDKYDIDLQFSHDWNFLWGKEKQNWYNFTPFKLDFEWGSYKGRFFSIDFVILNFYIYFEIYDIEDRKEKFKFVDKLVDGWKHGVSEKT